MVLVPETLRLVSLGFQPWDTPRPRTKEKAMRVIAGEAKGRYLKGPAGTFTRPMQDKIKEALFSMMDSLDIEVDRMLDLYAGTGSIGIEALSRGATWAEFVDQNAAACKVVRENIAI